MKGKADYNDITRKIVPNKDKIQRAENRTSTFSEYLNHYFNYPNVVIIMTKRYATICIYV